MDVAPHWLWPHPDAVAALLNSNGEIGSHFVAPPSFADELKQVPGDHIVTTSAYNCIEPAWPEDCFKIPGPHVGITRDADVLRVLAHRLEWRLPS